MPRRRVRYHSGPGRFANATAVGGSSENPGPSLTYGPETWWNDVATTPPAGQGGFGQSVFFNAPSYQSSLISGGRSVPDVVVNADPFHGMQICQADNGGCPNGLQYGGTSMAAPLWAAFTALLNQAVGNNLGFLNPQLYAPASSGAHVTFLTLNSTPTNLNYDEANTLTANLIDVSVNPPAPLPGQSVTFSAGGSELCAGTTDSNGNAACSYTPSSTNSFTMNAAYAGESFTYNPSADSRAVNVIAAPVTGSLRITPRKLNFGKVMLGSSKTKTVKVKNKGRITKRKTASPILLEMQSTDNSVFTVTMSCDDTQLQSKAKGQKPNICDIQVTFTPTAAQKYTGNLNIVDNLLPGLENVVSITGIGGAPKTPK